MFLEFLEYGREQGSSMYKVLYDGRHAGDKRLYRFFEVLLFPQTSFSLNPESLPPILLTLSYQISSDENVSPLSQPANGDDTCLLRQ